MRDQIEEVSTRPSYPAANPMPQPAAVQRSARAPSAPAAPPHEFADDLDEDFGFKSAQPKAPPPKESLGDKRRRWLRPALFALLPVALVGAGYIYVTGGRIMSTDDAYVNADQVPISTDVSGIVSAVNVRDNEYVHAGEVLYRLDPLQFQIALQNAKSNLAQTELSLESMKVDYKQLVSDAASQGSQVQLDQANYDRYAALLKANAIAKLIYDQAKFTLDTDKSKLEALREQASSQLTKLQGDPNVAVRGLPQYLQTLAQVREAQRELDHTVIRAPFSGTVTSVPSIAPGKYLAASATAFFLVDTDHVWIDATPKETELTYVRPGQPATITVDTYPHVVWHGTVASISPAAAQEFSLLPAQNTSGNWVKVVQRVPLRVQVDTRDKNMPSLRAGMSVIVNVDTGHTRGFPVL